MGQALPGRGDEPAGRRCELLTFFRFPKTQWKTLRTTNGIERLHESSGAA
jgi:transposase-like protein